MKKKGISAVVATVLIILITVAAVTIIWVGVLPMVQKNIASTEQFEVDLSIETARGYTVWDVENNLMIVQVRRGTDEVELQAIEFIFTHQGNSQRDRRSDVPEPNQMKTYNFNLSDFGEPESIAIAPVFADGSVGEVTTKLNAPFPRGDLSGIEGVFPEFGGGLISGGNVTYYFDFDGDSYGDTLMNVSSGGKAPAGYVVVFGDCNDNNANIYPGAIEFCDGVDNNCNGGIDEGCICEGDTRKFCGQFSVLRSEGNENSCLAEGCEYYDAWCSGADINRDGIVGQYDLSLVSGAFGNHCSSPDWCSGADINRDRIVGQADLDLVLGVFGKTGCDSLENLLVYCYSNINCSLATTKENCDALKICNFKWETFCLDNSDCEGREVKCVENQCKTVFEPRCAPFLNATWTSNLDILANGAFDRSKNSNYLSVVPVNDGTYALRARGDLGIHGWDRSVVKDFDTPMRSWGGTIYVNLKNLIPSSNTATLMFVGGYRSTADTETKRDLGIGVTRMYLQTTGDKLTYLHFRTYEYSSYLTMTYNSITYDSEGNYIEEKQNFDIADDTFNDISDPFPDRFIRIDWFFTPSYKGFARIDEGAWERLRISGTQFTDFKRFDIGWVSSYEGGSIDIKHAELYSDSCVPEWILSE